MHHITMYLDFVSPYAWLAFQQLPTTLQGLSCHVEYRPVLLGALLQQNSNPGPAGIPAKRIWTYRHVQWLGQHLGVPLQMPAQHPSTLCHCCAWRYKLRRTAASTALWQKPSFAMSGKVEQMRSIPNA